MALTSINKINKDKRLVSSTSKDYETDNDGYILLKPGNIMNGYRIIKFIGEGHFSSVWKADRISDGLKIALKIIRDIEKFRRCGEYEVKYLLYINEHGGGPENYHLNPLIESFTHSGHLCLVFPIMKSNLYEFIKQNKYRPMVTYHVKQIMKQILIAIKLLHTLTIIHSDIKPENITFIDDTCERVLLFENDNLLIPSDTRVTLNDLGSACFEDSFHNPIVVTRHYRAPEIVLGLPWSYPIDLWAAGCMCVEMVTGRLLFNCHNSHLHILQMLSVIGPLFPSYMFGHDEAESNCDYCNSSSFENKGERDKRSDSADTSKFVGYSSHLRKFLFQNHSYMLNNISNCDINDPYIFSRIMKNPPINQLKTLHAIIKDAYIEKEEFFLLYDFCSKLLTIDSEARMTATEALNHKFLANV